MTCFGIKGKAFDVIKNTKSVFQTLFNVIVKIEVWKIFYLAKQLKNRKSSKQEQFSILKILKNKKINHDLTLFIVIEKFTDGNTDAFPFFKYESKYCGVYQSIWRSFK